MKIIGRAGNDYIVRATRNELASISGIDVYNTPRLTGATAHAQAPDYWAVDTEINVVEAYNLIYKYQQHHQQLENAAANIETVAKAVAEDLRKKLYPITKDGKVVTPPTVEKTANVKGKKARRMINDAQGTLEFTAT